MSRDTRDTAEAFYSPRSTASQESDSGEDTVAKSIDRSRKRHLSEGLLRGDLIADRLAEQEATSSPVLKKARPPGPTTAEMALTMREFKEYMDANTNKRLESLDASIADVNRSVAKINKNVKLNTAKLEEGIRANKDSIAALRDELKNMQEAPPPKTTSPGKNVRLDEEFDKARRSLRLWPVHGTTREEIWNSTKFFLKEKLKLENQVSESMIEDITRAEIPPGPGVKLEVLVRMRSPEKRDLIMGASAGLAAFIDEAGKPTAGIRIQVPTALQATFRVLFRYGQSLRTRHGPGTRRHVKFDDLNRTLYLNVKLPGDERWSKVSFDMARRGMRARRDREDSELERRFDIGGPDHGGRPRAASTSNAERQSPMMTDAWTGRRTESVTLE